MNQLRQRMQEEMQLRRYAQRTQESYLHWVTEISKHYQKSADQISREELRSWFVYLTNERQLSRSSVTTALSALKFFYEAVLRRDWDAFNLVRPRAEHKLPVVLSIEEVQRLLACVESERHRVCLSVLYSCGLRLLEGTHLWVAQIDSSRMVLHIQNGKGNKDRYVPLPKPTLELLRGYWVSHRHPVWVFPATIPTGWTPPKSQPMDESGVQKAFKAALEKSGIQKAATPHTLRHSSPRGFPTHLLEAGINLRQIQSYLGHQSPMTTAIYTPSHS